MAIAEAFGVPVKASSSDWQWLFEETKALELRTIKQLDRLVAKHGRNARLLARNFQLVDTVTHAHGVQLVLEIEAMDRFGPDWYIKHLSGLKLTSAGRRYANDLWNYYQQVKTYGA